MAERSKNGIFSFDHFRLDSGKLMLYRGDEEVLIPPKVAKTLAVLVENAGTIISKDEVIEQVWDDSIVEEANLTQYLYLIRKVLGPMPDGKPYIETLRRRGYRFNGRVERLVDDELRRSVTSASEAKDAKEPKETTGMPAFGGVERDGNVLRLVDWKPAELVETAEAPTVAPAANPPDRQRSIWPRIAIAAASLIILTTATVFFLPRLMPAATNAESQRELSVLRLTNGPFTFGATISPDGNAFVYHENDGDTCRMFVQQTGQSSRLEIASSTDKEYAAKTFSPDGQSIYYLARDKSAVGISLYRIPTMGGASVKVLDNVNSPISFSPDGREFVFMRRDKGAEASFLVIAGRDGKGERVILQRHYPQVVGATAWSPNGKVIVFGELSAGTGRSIGREQLHTVDVDTGIVKPLSQESWDNVLRVMWAPDGSGLVLNGTRQGEGYTTRRDQIYFVSYPGGASRRITTDGNRHEPGSLGVTKSGSILAVPGNRSTQVWALNGDGDAATAVQLTRGAADGRAGLAPVADGKFAFLSRTAEDINLMLSNADASDTKQLATGFQFIDELRGDPNGRFFVFSSVLDGRNHLFRIDADDGGVKQLTFGEGGEIDSTVSPDGKFITFDSIVFTENARIASLIRIPAEGGEPVKLKTQDCTRPVYSPDGSLLSCVRDDKSEVAVISAADGAEVERHPLPPYATTNFGVGWTPDGTGLVYIVTERSTSNVWVQPRDGSKPHSLTNFSSGSILRYAFSPDGSKLYVARGFPIQDAILISNYR